MNSFNYKKTVLLKSELKFSNIENEINYSGEITLSTTFAIPRDPNEKKIVVLTLDLSFGSENDSIQLNVVSRSFFEILECDSLGTLQDDVRTKCYPKASEELSERIAELTKLHVGRALKISIPREI